MIVGHGVVARQVRGPASASGAPQQAVITLRRYRCRSCTAILVVGPLGLVRRRWYTGPAITVAVAALAAGETHRVARLRTSPAARIGASAAERWVTLIRWLEAARRGELFSIPGLIDLGRRRVAEHVVLALAARAGHVAGVELAESAFRGAAMAA